MSKQTKQIKTDLIEVFSSIQGEGPYIGYKQIFIRFAGCNLNCDYCDTNFVADTYFKYEKTPASNDFLEFGNPISGKSLLMLVKNLNTNGIHSISLTGGEPLLNAEFLKGFLPKIKKETNLKTYLETNGTLPEKLIKIIAFVDIISMDIKLESSCGFKIDNSIHSEFIDAAFANNKEIFTKVVVTSKTTFQEIENVIGILKDKNIYCIIQPITTINKKLEPSVSQLFEIQQKLLNNNIDARIIPQTHTYLGLN
ncbi:MAG: 7-carboxy-7-deazaguanine synthase QueE [Candidatus Gastranaerophilales bacterium]|nr:7-carboxy-7-deazaguanine synthase QueE [Candidatus Gastranaerophilales bacterium]